MSLTTDRFFYNALRTSDEVMEMTDGRIFNTARNSEDENQDKIPYIIIMFDGGQNTNLTKDDFEGDTDNVTVSILAVASTREQLANLTNKTRETIRDYWRDVMSGADVDEDCPDSCQFSASRIEYDMTKPCFYMTLRYDCETNNNMQLWEQ